MRLLALETSHPVASLALLELASGGADAPRLMEVGWRQLTPRQRAAEALVPAIQQLLAHCDWNAGQLDLVCAATGPGSFTGLRIGVTTAKTLAYAAGAELAGVHTLAAIATRAEGLVPVDARLWTLLDAQRGQLFAACWGRGPDGSLLEPAVPATRLLTRDQWLRQLQAGDWISGPAIPQLTDRLPADVHVVPSAYWEPRALEVGHLGYAAYQRGDRVDAMQLVPHYFRRSAAEEKQLA